MLEVSGNRTPEGAFLASTLKRVENNVMAGSTELEVEGNISAVDPNTTRFKVGNLTVNYGQSLLIDMTSPEQIKGEYVEIRSRQNLDNGILVADQGQAPGRISSICCR
ncbi:MAG: hypothetical protein R3E95_06475 [Thiolinea sp.]